jgi:N-acetylmuramoyl-L-alanine amidase
VTQRGWWWGALLVLAALPVIPAHARPHHSEAWARDRYAAADRMREALNGRPPAERTRHDYQRVINAFRNVYYGAPVSTKADPSAVAVAEVLVEMGRRFDDNKILEGAIAQYKFLRKEYPGSKYRADALFTIGEIYKDDLNDPEQARTTFEEFLHRYPHNRLAEDAQQVIVELKQQSADQKAQAEKDAKAEKKSEAKNGAGIGEPPTKVAHAEPPAEPESRDAQNHGDDAAETGESPSHHLPRVTAIRHWSTPDYTRVAIDLESEVKFGSQRISHPDRIFFDLRDTKLASTLVGKSFDVDDGFLKKIRVVQFQPERTRVVLEVDSLSTYEAFLLPNPYRLIIDIHGKGDKVSHAKLTKEEVAALADVEAPPQVDSKARVPKPEVKADMKALAGKPATK